MPQEHIDPSPDVTSGGEGRNRVLLVDELLHRYRQDEGTRGRMKERHPHLSCSGRNGLDLLDPPCLRSFGRGRYRRYSLLFQYLPTIIPCPPLSPSSLRHRILFLCSRSSTPGRLGSPNVLPDPQQKRRTDTDADAVSAEADGNAIIG